MCIRDSINCVLCHNCERNEIPYQLDWLGMDFWHNLVQRVDHVMSHVTDHVTSPTSRGIVSRKPLHCDSPLAVAPGTAADGDGSRGDDLS